jgi:hypothetical protein
MKYDNSGKLIKETFYTSVKEEVSSTLHFYSGELNHKPEFYAGKEKTRVREITKTYDKNNNLITVKSDELLPHSFLTSHILKYRYYEE